MLAAWLGARVVAPPLGARALSKATARRVLRKVHKHEWRRAVRAIDRASALPAGPPPPLVTSRSTVEEVVALSRADDGSEAVRATLGRALKKGNEPVRSLIVRAAIGIPVKYACDRHASGVLSDCLLRATTPAERSSALDELAAHSARLAWCKSASVVLRACLAELPADEAAAFAAQIAPRVLPQLPAIGRDRYGSAVVAACLAATPPALAEQIAEPIARDARALALHRPGAELVCAALRARSDGSRLSVAAGLESELIRALPQLLARTAPPVPEAPSGAPRQALAGSFISSMLSPGGRDGEGGGRGGGFDKEDPSGGVGHLEGALVIAAELCRSAESQGEATRAVAAALTPAAPKLARSAAGAAALIAAIGAAPAAEAGSLATGLARAAPELLQCEHGCAALAGLWDAPASHAAGAVEATTSAALDALDVAIAAAERPHGRGARGAERGAQPLSEGDGMRDDDELEGPPARPLSTALPQCAANVLREVRATLSLLPLAAASCPLCLFLLARALLSFSFSPTPCQFVLVQAPHPQARGPRGSPAPERTHTRPRPRTLPPEALRGAPQAAWLPWLHACYHGCHGCHRDDMAAAAPRARAHRHRPACAVTFDLTCVRAAVLSPRFSYSRPQALANGSAVTCARAHARLLPRAAAHAVDASGAKLLQGLLAAPSLPEDAAAELLRAISAGAQQLATHKHGVKVLRAALAHPHAREHLGSAIGWLRASEAKLLSHQLAAQLYLSDALGGGGGESGVAASARARSAVA